MRPRNRNLDRGQGGHALGKTGKMVKKNSLQGKIREFEILLKIREFQKILSL